MARKLKFGEDGVAELLDQDIFLMYGAMLYHMEDKAGGEISHKIGKEIGFKVVDDIKKMGLTGTKMIDFVMDLLTMNGLGEFTVEKFDLKTKNGEVWVKNSLIAREARKMKNKKVNCNFIAGLLSGIFSKNYESEINCEEVACINKNSKICRFLLRTN